MPSAITRRQLLLSTSAMGLGLLAGCGLPFAQSPPPKVYRIGYLSSAVRESTSLPPPGTAPPVDALWQGLREYGLVQDENLTIEWRVSDRGEERLRELADELVRLPVDVIVAGAGGAVPAKQATDTIPIIFVGGPDPVGLGLVDSLGRPGGNVTGLPIEVQENLVTGKQLELLAQAVPGLSRVVMLRDASAIVDVSGRAFATQNAVAQALGLQLQLMDVGGLDALEDAFETAAQAHVDGLVYLPAPRLGRDEARIAALALKHRLPSVSSFRTFAAAGGLISYGANLPALYRRVGYYVDRIRKGAKPADLPVEQPMTFDFVVNLKTAQALGITVPNEIMLQVTEVVQ